MDMTVPVGHRVNMKESEKLEKYHDLAWELRKISSMKVRIMPRRVDAFGTMPKTLELRLDEIEI